MPQFFNYELWRSNCRLELHKPEFLKEINQHLHIKINEISLQNKIFFRFSSKGIEIFQKQDRQTKSKWTGTRTEMSNKFKCESNYCEDLSTKCDGSDVSWQNSEPSIAISVSAILSRSYFQQEHLKVVLTTCLYYLESISLQSLNFCIFYYHYILS